MENSSNREIIKAEEGNRSWWQQCILTCLPAAAATFLISWISGGRKQSQQQLDDDEEDLHQIQKSASTSSDAEEQGIPICSSVSSNGGDLQPAFTESVSLSYGETPTVRDSMSGPYDVGRVEVKRFMVKPRNFMNMSSKK